MEILIHILLLLFCLKLCHVEGVEFFLRGRSIPTDGSGRLLITDISLHNRQTSTSDEEALICHSSRNVAELHTLANASEWYIDSKMVNTTNELSGERIGDDDHRGWTRYRERVGIRGKGSPLHSKVKLKRVSGTALEGKFTCHIMNDSNNVSYLLILYPIISVEAVVDVVTEEIHCTSTGGRVLNMSITGPHGVVSTLSNIQAVGTQTWMGNDSYSASGTVAGANDGDTYNCTASNGVSSATDSVEIRAVKKPIIESLKRVFPTEVRVEWSQPLGGANVTGYVVLYYDGSVTRNQTAPATATSAIITVLPHTLNYTISVMALSDEPFHLPGRSDWKIIELWSPEGVMVEEVDTNSVRVLWEAVEDADNYTVSFSQAVGDDQEGLCRDDPHSANVTVDNVSTASIAVGEDVRSDETSMLRAYTTYSVTVVAFSDVWGRTVGSEAVTFNTPQTKAAVAPRNVTVIALDSTVITVSWKGLTPCRLVNGHIVEYRVEYKTQSCGVMGSKDVSGNWSSGGETDLTGLTPSTNYSIAVAAVNEQGTVGLYSDPIVIRNQSGPIAPIACTESSKSSSTWQYTIVPVICMTVLIIVGAIITFSLALYYWKLIKKNRTFKTPLTNVLDQEKPLHPTDEPVIVEFPCDIVRVVEGKKVELRVQVVGQPEPKLTWYHDGEEVVTSYSTDLGLDGSLTIPCSEHSHSGVYQLVALNNSGRAERQLKLVVRKEEPSQPQQSNSKLPLSPVSVLDFEEYVSDGHKNDDAIFQEQFTELDVDADHSTTIGSDPDNVLLNRFANITVYDNNRIVLMPMESCTRDYINACYLDGYKCRKKYIATQGPLEDTVVDFWRLVWQERPPTIVMLTNLKEGRKVKCHKYWPDSGTVLFGPFRVTITDQQILADYTTRTFLLELNGKSERGLIVTQLHYTVWPEYGVPSEPTSLLNFHRKLKKQHTFPKRPILVHCSAGVGRTGTLVTIDWVLEQLLKERLVDVAGTIRHLRKQRMRMVQTLAQYIFIHDAILEELVCGVTQINPSDLRAAIEELSQQHLLTHTTGFEKQFKALSQLSSKAQEAQKRTAAQRRKKNRNSVFLDSLEGWSTELENEVVFVDGYKQKKAFIIAQSPTASATRDFWKMVYDVKCGVIINLNHPDEIQQEAKYWPDSGMMRMGEFLVDCLHVEELTGFVIHTFSLCPEKSGKAHQVYQIHVTCWMADGQCSRLKAIVDSISEVTKLQRRSSGQPVLVHCSDPVSKSGMFCAIATTIERCKTEAVVDVFQVVKALRLQKPGAVANVVQYKTIFDAVLASLDSSSN